MILTPVGSPAMAALSRLIIDMKMMVLTEEDCR